MTSRSYKWFLPRTVGINFYFILICCQPFVRGRRNHLIVKISWILSCVSFLCLLSYEHDRWFKRWWKVKPLEEEFRSFSICWPLLFLFLKANRRTKRFSLPKETSLSILSFILKIETLVFHVSTHLSLEYCAHLNERQSQSLYWWRKETQMCAGCWLHGLSSLAGSWSGVPALQRSYWTPRANK